jgi:hypothetical protein
VRRHESSESEPEKRPHPPSKDEEGASPAAERNVVTDVQHLQQSAGNQAVARWLTASRTPDAAGGADAGSVASTAATQVAGGSGSAGRLPEVLADGLGQSLGADVRDVRVHTDEASGQAASAIGARAFTSGQDVHFAPGAYDPASTEGRRLIAHEVAHTVQQRGRPAGVQGAGVGGDGARISRRGDPHEAEAERFADAFVAGGTAPVTAGSTSATPVVSRSPDFTPRFGGDAGVLKLSFLNANVKLNVSVKNARSAPRGTNLVWSWGATATDGVEKGDISPATGPNATFNAKAKKPTPARTRDEMAANLEVTEPGQTPVVHAVRPAMRVGVMEPAYEVEQKVVPGPQGGGSPASLKPGDVLEFRVTFDNVEKPKELGDAGHFRWNLTPGSGLFLDELGGVPVPDDKPFQARPHRWEGDTLVYSVYCHHAGSATYKLDFNVPGAPAVSREFPLKAETSLAFFLERCNAATDRHRALLATIDAYIQQGFMNYKAGFEAADAALKQYAERQRLTREILLGILFAGLGGAAGGAVGGYVKALSSSQKWFGQVASAATREALLGAVTDAPKDMVKYGVRLGRLLGGGGAGGRRAPTPDDATPDAHQGKQQGGQQGGGGPAQASLDVDPLNWYASIQKAKSQEEAKVATNLQLWKTSTIDAMAAGSTATIDFDPVNAVTESTKLGGKTVTELGNPPSAAEYEKTMWEAWIEKYAYTLELNVGCGQWGSHVEDNVGKEIKREMERVAKALQQKGIESSWLTNALTEARRIADEKARKSREL